MAGYKGRKASFGCEIGSSLYHTAAHSCRPVSIHPFSSHLTASLVPIKYLDTFTSQASGMHLHPFQKSRDVDARLAGRMDRSYRVYGIWGECDERNEGWETSGYSVGK